MPTLACRICGRVVYTTASLDSAVRRGAALPALRRDPDAERRVGQPAQGRAPAEPAGRPGPAGRRRAAQSPSGARRRRRDDDNGTSDVRAMADARARRAGAPRLPGPDRVPRLRADRRLDRPGAARRPGPRRRLVGVDAGAASGPPRALRRGLARRGSRERRRRRSTAPGSSILAGPPLAVLDALRRARRRRARAALAAERDDHRRREHEGA